jgi:hypothetical protein
MSAFSVGLQKLPSPPESHSLRSIARLPFPDSSRNYFYAETSNLVADQDNKDHFRKNGQYSPKFGNSFSQQTIINPAYR